MTSARGTRYLRALPCTFSRATPATLMVGMACTVETSVWPMCARYSVGVKQPRGNDTQTTALAWMLQAILLPLRERQYRSIRTTWSTLLR